MLRKPLQLLCDIQLAHGAVPHSSKEEKREQEFLLQKQLTKKEIIDVKEQGQQNESLGNDVKNQKHKETTENEDLDKSRVIQEVGNEEDVEAFQREYSQQEEKIDEKHSQTELHENVTKHVSKRPKLDN